MMFSTLFIIIPMMTHVNEERILKSKSINQETMRCDPLNPKNGSKKRAE